MSTGTSRPAQRRKAAADGTGANPRNSSTTTTSAGKPARARTGRAGRDTVRQPNRRPTNSTGICASTEGTTLDTRPLNDVEHRGLVVELRPSARQASLLRQHVGLARFVWNWALAQHQANGYPIGGKAGIEGRREAAEAKERGESRKMAPKLSSAELSRRWTQQVDTIAPWARELQRNVVTYAIRAVDDAYKHAFRRYKEGKRGREIGWPRFRHKHHPHRAFTIQDQSFRCGRWALKLGKIGMVPVRNARRHDDLDRLNGTRVLRIVVSEKAERWFATLMFERPRVETPPTTATEIVGLDLGHVLSLSNGWTYEPPKPLERYERWIANWQRARDRRKGGKEPSRRWLRAKRNAAALHLRAASIRKDWIEQVTTELSRRYHTIVTEGFDVRRMVSEAVDHRAGRKTIMDIGWGDFRLALARKMQATGGTLLILGKHEITDQTCSRCGAEDPRTNGLYQCEACGHEDTRPRNTADLLARIGRGDPPPRFGRSDAVRTPSGEDGDNARGAGNGPSEGRRLRSETGHEDAGGAGALSGPAFPSRALARKIGGSTHSEVRASARISKASKRSAAKRERGPRNGGSSS